ncbi:MAG: exodeoxyribonuclease III [Nannocystaceae bacterium]
MSESMTVVTWNVNGIRARLDHVLTYLSDNEPDIVCLQESKVANNLFPRVPFMELGYHLSIHGAKGYAGVVTLSKSKPTEVHLGWRDDPPDTACRVVNTVVDGIRIYNVYCPNGTKIGTDKFDHKINWFRRLRSELDATETPESNVLIVGDFNIAPDARDVYDEANFVGQLHYTDEEHAVLNHVLAFGLEDCFRKFNQEGGHFTWFDYRAGAFRRKRGMRIDHVYATKSVAARVTEVVHDREPRTWEKPSDHMPVVTTLTR